ncbi:MAG: tRNA epoxyqueuosine(34) reductase QueG [Dehalococcoidia bacterium]|nr:tRNA epoxyqueuosine(34) reductase QueG [Dehalococcoidia bacterium]
MLEWPMEQPSLAPSVAGPAEPSDADPAALAARVKQLALAAGFDRAGIARAEPFTQDAAIALARIQRGLLDGLPWFHADRVRRGADPQQLLSGARSIVSLALGYRTVEPPQAPASELRGRVSRYAWGRDYHAVVRQRLKAFLRALRQEAEFRARTFVDTGPMLDRAAAVRAGVGWFGKNTNVLTTSHGSWVFLAQVLTDLRLAPDPPLRKSCGACTRCLPACPTGALTPYELDNRRCISYLTIENRGPIARELRTLMGTWAFGCDLCQEACPVNGKAAVSCEAGFLPRSPFQAAPPLLELLGLSGVSFRERFAGTAVLRAKRWGLQRNACVALGRLGTPEAARALAQALAAEADAGVREEVRQALLEARAGRVQPADAL